MSEETEDKSSEQQPFASSACYELIMALDLARAYINKTDNVRRIRIGQRLIPHLKENENIDTAALRILVQAIERYEIALEPRRWDRQHNDAWHSNIPDMIKAFNALRNIVHNRQIGIEKDSITDK
jgi:hypothetical protein